MTFFPTTVLVGVDSTKESRHAVTAAVQLCLATGSPLHLVHVKLTSGMLRGRPMSPQQRSQSEDEGLMLLEQHGRQAAEAGLEPAKLHLRYAENTEHELARLQQQLVAGLLVIGEGSTGGLARRLFGTGGGPSAVRRSPGSVMVVRPPEAGLG